MRKLNTQLALDTLFLLIIFGLMIGLVLAQANPYITLPGRDNGFFLYAGAQLLDGKLPYIDFWDSKPPGVFYINALGLLIGKGSRWGVWLIEFLFLLISSTFFFISTRKKWGQGAAFLSSIAWLYGMSRVLERGNFTEEYSLFFSFLALAYFLYVDSKEDKKLAFFLGATFALNFLLRANNIGIAASGILALLFSKIFTGEHKKIPRILLWIGCSSGTIFLITFFYFLQKGVFVEMFKAAILYNLFYSTAKHTLSLNLWQKINYIGWPAYVAFGGYFYTLYQAVRNYSKNITHP
ncbi:MAG: glycosyltransferase family 39 protein [Chloroflexi bacterium]|nr:glycosyltransferase family 39 protein [Chloroflexota bacterium]